MQNKRFLFKSKLFKSLEDLFKELLSTKVIAESKFCNDNLNTFKENSLNTVWIFGAIDNTEKRNFIIKRVDNRKVETLLSVLKDKVIIWTVFCSDRYPSCPNVAESLRRVTV